jgi:hypothetical protein
VDAADPSQTVELHRCQIGDIDVGLTGVNARGRQKSEEQKNYPEPVFVISHKFKPHIMAEEGRDMPTLFSSFLSNTLRRDP